MQRVLFYYLFLGVFLSILYTCQPPSESSNEAFQTPREGLWRAILKLPGGEAPFQLEFQSKDAQTQISLINGEESFLLDEYEFLADSVYIELHTFGAALAGKLIGDSLIQGKWIKYGYNKPYEVPFEALYSDAPRFSEPTTPAQADFNGTWSVTFIEDDSSKYPAIGIFEQEGQKVKGTFLTTTGDYRYLEGVVEGREMQLATFDGGHGFLFKAQLDEENQLAGEFWSGALSYETFTGFANDTATLADANKLTYLKEGYDKVTFAFPNLQGDTVTLADPKYQDKVIILQIFGTWCPNCLDETAFLAPYYAENKDRGLEIIGLAYERQPDFERARTLIQKMIKRFDIQYDFLVAGISNKLEAAKTLPMLNHIKAFPTTIFIDRQGEVRRIHTGFTGPGTGKYYEKFVLEFRQFMDELLDEKVAALE